MPAFTDPINPDVLDAICIVKGIDRDHTYRELPPFEILEAAYRIEQEDRWQ